MTQIRFIIVIAVLLAAPVARGQSLDMSCPRTIETKQALAGVPPNTWSPVLIAEQPVAGSDVLTHRLANVQFTSGPASERAFLVPDNPNSFGKGKRFVQRWSSVDAQRAHVVCEYTSTFVHLSRAVPAGYKRCEVAYENGQPPTVLAVTCKR